MVDRPWIDKSKPVPERVTLLLCAMTLEEKIGQMNQVANLADEHGEELRKGTIGSSLFASGWNAGNVRDEGVRVGQINNVQKIAVEQSRLGIPVIFARDVIHGYRTVFPIPLGQAATWNPETVRAGAEVSAREAAAAGLHWTFAPMCEVCHDGRWGRIAEGFGEDPFLASRLTEAAVLGYQGDDLSAPDRIAACVKHFAGYSGAEGGRDYGSVTMGERTLRDVYLPPFHAAAKAGCATVMSSFNEIDGIPVSANRHILTGILKEEWGFDGFIVSDWGIIGSLWRAFGFAADLKECAKLSANAGLDMDMCSNAYIGHLAELVREGAVPQALIDDLCGRILSVKFRCGLFERPYTDETRAASIMFCDSHKQTARATAAETMVLLKNNGILPLRKDIGAVTVTGPFAQAKGELFGTWTLDGVDDDVLPVGDAIKQVVAEKTRVHIDNVFNFADLTPIICRRADVVIACIGEGPWLTGEGNSITTLDLPVGQIEVLASVHALGVPIVAVVFAGRPLGIGRLAELCDAVLYVWHPGVMGGAAVADVLFGDKNPGGRLPVTFPRCVGQIPTYYNHRPTHNQLDETNRRRGRYRDTLDQALYPFGYGLDYTTFAYADLRLSAPSMPVDGALTVSVDVTNTGSRDGTEVVQLYIRDLVASVVRPLKELKGFAKVRLMPGEKKTVTLTLRAAELAFTGVDMKPVVEPGTFKIWVGPNADNGLEGKFAVVVEM